MVPHATIVGVKPIDDWRPVAEAAMKILRSRLLCRLPRWMARRPTRARCSRFRSARRRSGAGRPGFDPIAQHIVQGKLEDLKPGEFGVVLGDITAPAVFAWVSVTRFTLIVPEASTAPGGITPRLQRFECGRYLQGSGRNWTAPWACIHVADAAAMQHWEPNQVQSVRLAGQGPVNAR